MSFEPEAGHPTEAIEEFVDEMIEDNDVVLFMKGTKLMPQCGYSRKALGLLQRHSDAVTTVDVLHDLESYRGALARHSDRETIPQAFVDGEFLGGSDILEQLEERGDLAEQLP